ncbi:MAG: sugar ABC transporter permease [Anaerolineae bacterium]|nr:sugar ABC transporter permease [Anaerolineae bacterium]
MKKIKRRGFIQALPFIAPAIIIIVVVLIYPLLYTFGLSFFDYSIARGLRFSGLGNYIKIIHDDKFITSLINTLYYTVVVVTVEGTLGFILASILNQEFPGRGLIRGLLMIPMLTSPIVSAITWRFMYNPDFGIINYLFSLVGLLPQVWTGDPKTALPSIMIVDIWEFTPFVMLLLLAGLQSIPQEQYEAAMIDGAGSWARTRYITIPWLRPMILVVLLLRTMDSIKIFDQVYALTAGGPGVSSMTLGVYAYINGFRNFHLGYAATISWVLALITIAICAFYIRSIQVPDHA